MKIDVQILNLYEKHVYAKTKPFGFSAFNETDFITITFTPEFLKVPFREFRIDYFFINFFNAINFMKRKFTKKLSCLALGVLMVVPQMKAEDKVNYTDVLKNPGFELALDPQGNEMAASKENNNTHYAVNDWFRFVPYGWHHKVVYQGTEIVWDANNNRDEATTTIDPIGVNLKNSIGVNQDVQVKTREGLYAFWSKPDKPLDFYEFYQEVTVGNGEGQLPAGEYVVSCRLAVMGVTNTDKRFTTQRLFAKTDSENKVQYFGRATDYSENGGIINNDPYTDGEIATYADWISDNSGEAAKIWLRPMAVTITVKDGEVLRLGVKTSDKLKDGTAATGTDVGWFKADGFRIMKKMADDRTSYLKNPSFELKEVLNEGTQLKEEVRIAGASDVTHRWIAYGWHHSMVREYTGSTPIILPWTATQNNTTETITEGGAAFGQSTGTNLGDAQYASLMDRGYYSYWAGANSMPEYTLYQEVTGLPAGKYQLSCYMLVLEARNGTQRLFANNNVTLFATEFDYNLENQLTIPEKEKLAEGKLKVSFAGHTPANGDFKLLTVDVDLAAGETLRLGVKSSGVDAFGVTATNNTGIIRVDEFRLKYLGAGNSINNTQISSSSVIGQKGGCFLHLNGAGSANVRVVSLSGQVVYNGLAKDGAFISLPQGLYVVQVDGKATKVLVK